MNGQTAIILGATGLTGSYLLYLLLEDPIFSTVRVLVRRPVNISNPKLEIRVVNFDDYHDLKEKLGPGHAIFCCIGTTQSKVKGDKEAYRKVDYGIPVNAAHAGKENGIDQYVLMSAVGANEKSKNFYLKLKGEVEGEIAKVGFRSVHFLRPSILLGERNEFRPAESLAKGLMKATSFLFIGKLSKYKAIHSRDVARAMLAASRRIEPGVSIYEYDEIQKLLQQHSFQ